MSALSLIVSLLPKLTGADPGAIRLDSGTAASPEYRRAHDAAAMGRRTAGWYAPEAGPNAVIFADNPELIRRSRAAYRNNGWIKQGIIRHVANEVTAHIYPLFELESREIKKALDDAWFKFVKYSDADGVLSFYGQLALASMTRRVSGECFIRIRPRRMNSGRFMVPFQLQLLEPDMVPSTLCQEAVNGNEIIHGIEFDRSGQRTAYYVYKRHPYDWSATQGAIDINETVRIPARLILHHYLPERPGQIRGRPDTVQSLVAAFEYQEYSDAERVRKKTKAAHTAFLERGEYPEEDDYLYDPMTGAALTDAQQDQTNIEPGMYNVLNPGEHIKFPDGDNTGSGYSDFQRWQLLSMAAGFAQPYQIFTGDLQGMNDRLWRAITNEYYQTIDMCREHGIIPQICEPVKDFFVDSQWLNELIDLPDYETRRDEYLMCQWQQKGRRYVNLLQEVQAYTGMVEAGFTSRQAVIAELNGRDADAVDRERAEDKEREEEFDLSMQPPPGNQPGQPQQPADDNADDQETDDNSEDQE